MEAKQTLSEKASRDPCSTMMTCIGGDRSGRKVTALEYGGVGLGTIKEVTLTIVGARYWSLSVESVGWAPQSTLAVSRRARPLDWGWRLAAGRLAVAELFLLAPLRIRYIARVP